jgi:hypothetical protein
MYKLISWEELSRKDELDRLLTQLGRNLLVRDLLASSQLILVDMALKGRDFSPIKYCHVNVRNPADAYWATRAVEITVSNGWLETIELRVDHALSKRYQRAVSRRVAIDSGDLDVPDA